MPPRRRQSQKDLLSELGLLNDAVGPGNPYADLGIDQEFAQGLLSDDPTGDTLRTVANGLYRTMAKIYYPDVAKPGLPDRYTPAKEANRRIGEATVGALTRWAKSDRPTSPGNTEKVQAELIAMSERTASFLQTNVELGQHPQHFSSLWAAQGVLLSHNSKTLLLRQNAEGGINVVRGITAGTTAPIRAIGNSSQLFDFDSFMRHNNSFGIEPGTEIVTYIDGNRRASILEPNLSFVMDITDPVAVRRHQRARVRDTSVHRDGDTSDYWLRSQDPLLFVSRVPGSGSSRDPASQVTQFPEYVGDGRSRRSIAWKMPMEVAGSIGDTKFFNRARRGRAMADLAINSGNTQRVTSYFNLLATQAQQIIDQEAGYTPLLARDNLLLLYDTEGGYPVVTDSKVIGMIGSNARAA